MQRDACDDTGTETKAQPLRDMHGKDSWLGGALLPRNLLSGARSLGGTGRCSGRPSSFLSGPRCLRPKDTGLSPSPQNSGQGQSGSWRPQAAYSMTACEQQDSLPRRYTGRQRGQGQKTLQPQESLWPWPQHLPEESVARWVWSRASEKHRGLLRAGTHWLRKHVGVFGALSCARPAGPQPRPAFVYLLGPLPCRLTGRRPSPKGGCQAQPTGSSPSWLPQPWFCTVSSPPSWGEAGWPSHGHLP